MLWVPGLGGAAAATAGAMAWGAYNPRSRLFGPVIRSGPREPVAYLTFDDGPNPQATDAILEVLDREQVPAAFFMVGRFVERLPALARRVAAAGHEIGNHTWSHRKLHLQSPTRIRDELARTSEILGIVTGRRPRFFRAPHGYRNPWVSQTVTRLGLHTVGWSLGVWDSARPGASVIRERVGRHLRPGAILLLHDGDGYDPEGNRLQTAEALPGIIADARAAGFTFGRLERLLPCRSAA